MAGMENKERSKETFFRWYSYRLLIDKIVQRAHAEKQTLEIRRQKKSNGSDIWH